MDFMIINFKTLELDDIVEMLPYFRATNLKLSGYSAAFLFMWRKYRGLQFAYIENCIVFKEEAQGGIYFHYPMELNDGDEQKALDAIERYTRENNIRLHFTCVPRNRIMVLIDRYGAELRLTNNRKWRDYMYSAEDFKNFAGKKFSGQRNHINKFYKLYPGAVFSQICAKDNLDEIMEFMRLYESRQLEKGTLMAKEELNATYALIPNIDKLHLLCGALRVDGKMVALSIGERCGETLIIHIEKALTEYEGAYPSMAQAFARNYAVDGVKYVNREDDSGDPGLRKSKLQYNPVFLVDKYDVFPRRAIDRLAHIPVIKSQRLTMKEIADEDALALYELEFNEERNKYWGYNWREHVEGTPAPDYFLKVVRHDFDCSEEMNMGIYLDERFIGEVVLHNFGYRNDCEVGMRLLESYEGFGYAKEAVLAVINYAFYDLNVETIRAKCYKQNTKSFACLTSVGLKNVGEDETFYYFVKTAAM
jgi:hypothetical protein